MPCPFAHGARREPSVVTEKHSVGVRDGREPRAHRACWRATDSAATVAGRVGFKKEPGRRANESQTRSTPTAGSLRDVLLHVRRVNARRQRQALRIEVRRQTQPLTKVIGHDVIEIPLGHQGTGDVIDASFVSRRSIAL